LSQDLNPFGPRGWDDVRVQVNYRLLRKFPTTPPADVEDAVSSAMVDLVDYWVNLGTSVSPDTERNFNYAVWRGSRTALDFLVQRFRQWTSEPYLEQLLSDAAGDDDSDPQEWFLVDPQPGPEQQVIEGMERQGFMDYLEALDESEWDGWLQDYLDDLTVREAGERRGVSHVAVVKRRKRGIERMKEDLT
jgi:RNA polymerase sigma factor (sigma-70 family)